MTVETAIIKAVLKATRKKKTAGDLGTKFAAMVESADSLQKLWERKADWNSLRSKVDLPDTVTATDTFDLDTTIRKLSKREGDQVIITHTDDVISYYDLVPIDRLNQFDMACAQVGTTIVFNEAFTADSPQFGGTITVPAYLYAADITETDGSDPIAVDDPMWMVAMLAAEWARNDKVRQFMEQDFLAEADELLVQMEHDNGSQIEEVQLEENSLGVTW